MVKATLTNLNVESDLGSILIRICNYKFDNPAGNYMFKVNNRNNIFIINFEQISHLSQISSVSIVNFE